MTSISARWQIIPCKWSAVWAKYSLMLCYRSKMRWHCDDDNDDETIILIIIIIIIQYITHLGKWMQTWILLRVVCSLVINATRVYNIYIYISVFMIRPHTIYTRYGMYCQTTDSIHTWSIYDQTTKLLPNYIIYCLWFDHKYYSTHTHLTKLKASDMICALLRTGKTCVDTTKHDVCP